MWLVYMYQYILVYIASTVVDHTVCGSKISECDRGRVFCTQINPSQKKAERSQLRIDRLRLTTLADFSVEL